LAKNQQKSGVFEHFLKQIWNAQFCTKNGQKLILQILIDTQKTAVFSTSRLIYPPKRGMKRFLAKKTAF